MATRTTIKSKTKVKLGAAASLAAGGVVLSVDAGASSDPLGANGNALLESAFRLLEEGQNQFLAADEVPAQDSPRFRPEVNAAVSEVIAEPQIQAFATAEATAPDVVIAEPQIQPFTTAEATVPDVVIAQAPMADLVLAQNSTPAAAVSTPASAAETAISTSAAGATPSAVGAVQAAVVAEAGAAAIVGFSPLAAAALGVGGVAVVADAVTSTAVSDLNNDQDINVLNDSARLFSISGESVNSNEGPVAANTAGLIGGTNFIDDSTNSFFA